jgi:hypothetical protein
MEASSESVFQEYYHEPHDKERTARTAYFAGLNTTSTQ